MSEKSSNKPLLLILTIVLLIGVTVSAVWIYSIVMSGDKDQTEEFGPVFETEEFTVNLSESLNHYIKARFALELDNKKALEELEEKLPILQDSVIMVLSRQHMDSLSTMEGKEMLKESLIKAINSFLHKGQVTKVYFKNIIFS